MVFHPKKQSREYRSIEFHFVNENHEKKHPDRTKDYYYRLNYFRIWHFINEIKLQAKKKHISLPLAKQQQSHWNQYSQHHLPSFIVATIGIENWFVLWNYFSLFSRHRFTSLLSFASRIFRGDAKHRPPKILKAKPARKEEEKKSVANRCGAHTARLNFVFYYIFFCNWFR